ncbi:MAG: hypothetical protein M3430_10225 [Acidobacteriota bacterium]|nr:hypothetical protein [Acidobacteriota bacterium]
MIKTFRVHVLLSFAVLVIALNGAPPHPSKAEGGRHRPALRGEPPSYNVRHPPTPEVAGDDATLDVQVDDSDNTPAYHADSWSLMRAAR